MSARSSARARALPVMPGHPPAFGRPECRLLPGILPRKPAKVRARRFYGRERPYGALTQPARLSPKPLRNCHAHKEQGPADDHLDPGRELADGVVGDQAKLPIGWAAMIAHDCRPGGIDDAWTARGSIRHGHDVKRPRRNDGKAEEAEYQARGRGEPHKGTDVVLAEAHRMDLWRPCVKQA
jgi:hypothetical protein